MKRDDLKGIIEGVSDEQITKILDINTADIGKAKGSFDTLKADLEKTKETIVNYEKTIKELQESAGDADGLKVKISDLEKQINDREEADKQATADKAMSERFAATLGENKFINGFTEKGVMDEFKAALGDKTNTGKSDADIYAAIVKDRDGLFTNPNPPGDIPGTGKVSTESLEDDKIRAVMGLPPKK